MTLISFQISSIIIIVFAAFVIILFEREYPYNTDQKIIRSGFWTDLLFYNILQSFFLGILISFLIEFIDNSANLSRLQLITDWPWFIQIIFFTITHDFYIYWFHRFQHKNKFLLRLHEAHHSPKEVDWLSGVRSHGLEIFINQTIEFLPIVLLGAPPEIAVLKGLVSAVWGMYIHSNLDI
jgi:sterol desaturase/sphingolipid hydroxylase (fatty acid hydroxylase superfamily)